MNTNIVPDPDESLGQKPGESLGAYLRRVREARGLSLTEAAAAVGASYGAVASWETERRRPSGAVLKAYARVLGIETPSRDAPGPDAT